MQKTMPVPGTDGGRYVPFDARTGDRSVVFFTRDLSEKGLLKIYDRVASVLTGKVAIKLHTGEAEGPNIIPRPWVRELIDTRLPTRRSSRPTPITRAAAIPPKSTARRS